MSLEGSLRLILMHEATVQWLKHLFERLGIRDYRNRDQIVKTILPYIERHPALAVKILRNYRDRVR